MMCNELLLRRILAGTRNPNHEDAGISGRGSDNQMSQFQAVIMQESFGRVLASITEFVIDIEVIDRYNQFSHMYGNKHLDKKTQAMITQNSKQSNSKYFQTIRYWKVSLHVMSKCEKFSTIISFNDLNYFYETEIFEYFENNPNVPLPNLIELLGDYLKYLFKYRKSIGTQVFWRFPFFRKPLKMGSESIISAKQLEVNKAYKMIGFYKDIQEQINQYNELIAKEEDIPLSLNKQQRKKLKKAPPALSLRPKFIVETSLPLFNDLNVLTATSTDQEVVLQKPKYLDGVMCLITITLHK